MRKLYDFAKEHLLSHFVLTTNLTRQRSGVLREYTEEFRDDGVSVVFQKGYKYKSLSIDARFGESGIVFSLHAKLDYANRIFESFSHEGGITLDLGDMEPDRILGSCCKDAAFWTHPQFTDSFAKLNPHTQSLLLQKGAFHYHLLPLCGDNFRCEIEAGKLRITSDMCGLYELTGDFLAVSVSTDPFRAVEENYRNARALGGIRVPLREERPLPEIFRGFGWCTWNSFYAQVTGEKIFTKLDEFREKGIPVKWVLIDDGWMSTENYMLTSFREDPVKFPEGLKATVARIKSEYGVEKVGVWHTFHGYWNGILENSPLYTEQKENLVKAPCGLITHAPDEEKAFVFWDCWHTYLRSCGIDFLKIDNQSGNASLIEGILPVAEGSRIAHKALERSIMKNFGGAVINCMGMGMENVLSRPFTALSRNSDDFFPKRAGSFRYHLTQNVYNAVWHNKIYHCDFDMWWSRHEAEIASGVLRAISGSPVYVSDAVGGSDAKNILATIEDNGQAMLCDHAAMPTADCLYTDCIRENKILKIWNRSGDCLALAAFNVSDTEMSGTVDFGMIPELDRNRTYVAYEYFSGKYQLVHFAEEIELSLPKDGCAVWSLYPVVCPDPDSDEGAYILLGNTEKYVPIASPNKVKTLLKDIL